MLALLALGLALLFGGMPAYAHMGEAHTGQSVETPDTAGASTSEMPMQQMEMTWPSGDDSGGMMMRHKEGPKTMMGRTVSWLGAWHPAVIHFPIALLLTVAFLELAAWFTHKPVYAASNKLLLALATLGAFAAAPLGWANAGLPTPDEGWALNAHRWIGSTVPFLFVLVWYLKPAADQAKRKLGKPSYELLLAVAVMVILGQAFLGGEVTHGANHMAF